MMNYHVKVLLPNASVSKYVNGILDLCDSEEDKAEFPADIAHNIVKVVEYRYVNSKAELIIVNKEPDRNDRTLLMNMFNYLGFERKEKDSPLL